MQMSMYSMFRITGRLAFPLYVFLLVEGFLHTHDRKKYGINLFAFAIISEIPWNLEHTGSLFYAEQNVFFTLFFGYVGICCYENFKNDNIKKILALSGLFILSFVFKADYGVKGYCFILFMYIMRKDKITKSLIGSCFFSLQPVILISFLIMSLFIPESPVYIKMKNKELDTHVEHAAGLSELMAPRYRSVLLLGLIIAVFQQWCGTNVIFNYAQEIFVGAGFNVDGMFINIVITGIANVLFTFVALYTIERWGRRTLMLLGAGGLGIIYFVLGCCYWQGVTGVMIWTLLAEIFPHRIRGVAMATCTFALWVGCCTLTFSFPSMNAALGSNGTFWCYSTICLFAFLFLWRRCPETKGKSLEELEQELTS